MAKNKAKNGVMLNQQGVRKKQQVVRGVRLQISRKVVRVVRSGEK